MRIFQLQRLTAVALLVFMTIHMVVLHYPLGAEDISQALHVDFNNVIVRLEQPIWKAIDIGFLFAVLVHALLGAYMVLTDLHKVYPYRKALMAVAVLIFLVAMVYGSWTIISFRVPVGGL